MFVALVLLATVLVATETYAVSCLSGTVRDASGVPMANVDLDFFDQATGVKLVTPRDNTDNSGFYNICVLSGTYRVTFAPRRGSRVMGTEVFDIELLDNQSRTLDVVLQSGLIVSGSVKDSLGNPIGDIDLDFDRLTGGRVYTGDDNSLPGDGSFWVVVPPDQYRLRFDPPIGSGWRGLQIDSFVVTKDTAYHAVLSRGFALSGSVRDTEGHGLPDIDVELKIQATGEKVFVSDNSTDLAGNYSVVVPRGEFELRFVPLPGSRLIGQGISGFTIDGDTTWSVEVGSGILVSVTVTDENDIPIENVDIDFNVPGTGAKLFTPHDKTDANGVSVNAISSGVFDLELDPPVGAPYDRLTISNVNFRVDTAVTARMPEVNRVRMTGRVVDESEQGVPEILLELRNPISGAKIFLQNNLTDLSGSYDIAVPTGDFTLHLIPPITTRYIAGVIRNLRIDSDTALSPFGLVSGYRVACVVTTAQDTPIANANIDVNFTGNAAVIFTPYDKTDPNGVAHLVLPLGAFDLKAVPPSGSDLLAVTMNDVTVTGDTTLVFALKRADSDAENVVLVPPPFPNPFSTTTTIRYELLETARTIIKVYSIGGELIRTLRDQSDPVGGYEVEWDGHNADNQEVADGVYVCLIQANDSTRLLKLARIRR